MSPVRLSWDEGSRLPPQTPNPPGPGPAARHAKPWLGGRSLDALQIPGASTLGLGLRGRSGTRTAAAGRQGPPARSPAVTFPRAAWESAAPPAGCALSPSPPRADGRSRLSDPAPRRRPRPPAQAPPLRPGGPARSSAGPVGLPRGLRRAGGCSCSRCCPRCRGAAAAAGASRRPRCPELSRGLPRAEHGKCPLELDERGPCTCSSSSSSTRSLLLVQNAELHPRSTESESTGVRPSTEYFNKLLGWFQVR